MKILPRKSTRLWALYGVLLAGLVYSAFSLTVKPVYAAGCTEAQCIEGWYDAAQFCNGQGGLLTFQCPAAGSPNQWFATCGNGNFTYGPCD
jgi:hypothetical protein